MNEIVLHDAADLAATVERAARLLDDGDLVAARILAAHAHDEASAALKLAERFHAAERLTAKARQLQGDALLIEARAKMAIADEWDAAKAAGLAGDGRPRKDGKTVSGGNGFTAADLGMTRKEIHTARQLRDAEKGEPGIVARAIEARLSAGLSPTRANLRAAVGTATASHADRGLNFYETPPEAVAALLAVERFAPVIWEPACGRGAIVRPLQAAGYRVLFSDLEDRGFHDADGVCQECCDFIETRAALGGARARGNRPWLIPEGQRIAAKRDRVKGVAGLSWRDGTLFLDGMADIVTNPPYGADLNAFVAHALRQHRPGKMALLLNLNFLAGFENDDRNFVLETCPPARIWVFKRRLPMMHRDGWDGNEASSRMNTAWFVWERDDAGRHAADTVIRRIDWKDHA